MFVKREKSVCCQACLGFLPGGTFRAFTNGGETCRCLAAWDPYRPPQGLKSPRLVGLISLPKQHERRGDPSIFKSWNVEHIDAEGIGLKLFNLDSHIDVR